MLKTDLLSRRVLFLAAFSFLFLTHPSFIYADDIVCKFEDLSRGDLVVDGFELKNNTEISIDAIGAEWKKSDDMIAYGWILDAEGREPVWVMADEDTRRYNKSRYLREFDDKIELKAGRYEVLYFVGESIYLDNISINIDGLSDAAEIFREIFNSDNDDEDSDNEDYFEDTERLRFAIRAPEGSFTKFNPVEEMSQNAFIDFTRPDDDFIEKKGFTLKKEIPVKIIAIGEYSSGDRVFVDYGWIMNADTREKVWQMDKWNTSWAGGGRKNRGFNDIIKLPAGNYVAGYATDDSHSFGDWNVPPPYDPLHYGLAIYTTNSDDRKYITDFVDDFSEPVIISLTKVRNNRFEQKRFMLKKDMDLHIMAIGEYGYSDEFVDYGWIENLASEQIVWEMTEDNTEHAGGAKKNRKFDGVINLPKGEYMVYYVTDDSHAYQRWNDSAPIDKDMWGISIFGVGKNFDPKSVEVFDKAQQESENILVNLTGVGDDEDVHQSFVLDKEQQIKISALGEGSGGTMYDYGWIEEAETGDVVWEMTYRRTRHAGGADKNRKIESKITLPAGKYYAYFETDGSHSFPNFNASRPENPQKWGIIVKKD